MTKKITFSVKEKKNYGEATERFASDGDRIEDVSHEKLLQTGRQYNIREKTDLAKLDWSYQQTESSHTQNQHQDYVRKDC